ncbi:MAG: SDR family oxidoreductase [Planctomycetota bacterium]
MQNTALVTGASSGIGKELARLHAAHGGDLVLVARRAEALTALQQELTAEHGVEVVCLPMDLTDPSAPRALYQQVKQAGIEIDYLMNNAGFGGHGRFHERPWDKDHAMIQLNVTTLTELTHRFLQDMVARQRGRILNTASTAGFLPGPLQAVYYATKAYVVSFSQALAEELRSENITVTALCPGPVSTEFTQVGDLEGVEAFKNMASPVGVAQLGYDAMLAGKLVAINDWKLKTLLYWVLPFVPRRTMLAMSRRSMEKSPH